MFGLRSDGRLVKDIDPIVMITPYIMPKRDDSQVMTRHDLDFEGMTQYIREKRKEGVQVTYMGLIIAAFLRTLCEYPDLNRFIMNKRIYARNHVCVSFITLKKNPDDSLEEAVVKVDFQLSDTIYDVTRRVEAAIAETRKPGLQNKTDKLVKFLLSMPLLPDIVVALAKLLDRYGLMPSYIHQASPFHTSLFISNMASIGMNYIYHHIYNFGTTSLFFGMGKTEQRIHANADGTCRSKRIMPIGAVIDERICSGATFSRAFSLMKTYINNPSLLENAPETIKTETKMRTVSSDRQVNA
ncbi:MAG: 2-oxo acid dehydrogenase subunit E2 [Clostridia bacterium]|nr:2-oxo acid dehydrogenase subunit E2 [Clostridia bacterium]